VEKSIYRKIFLVSLLSFAFLCAFFSSPQKANSASPHPNIPPDMRTLQNYNQIFKANKSGVLGGLTGWANGCDYGLSINYDKNNNSYVPYIKITRADITRADNGYGTDPKRNNQYPGWTPSTWQFKLVDALEARGYFTANDNYYYFQCQGKPDASGQGGGCDRLAIQVNSKGGSIAALYKYDPAMLWQDLDPLAENKNTLTADFCMDDDAAASKFFAFIKWAQDGQEGVSPISKDKIPNISQSAGLVQKNINGAIRHVFDVIGSIVDTLGRMVIEPFLIVNLRGNTSTMQAINSGWVIVRDTANVLLILGLLFIAVANAIRFQIDYYTAKMLLPRLIIAAIFVNFSQLMAMAILDLANVLTYQFIRDIQFTNLIILSGSAVGGKGVASTIAYLVGTIVTSGLSSAGLAIFLAIVVGITLLTLIAVLIARIMIIYLLVVFSPLVFLFSVLPFTRGLTSTWWGYLTRWVFMGPVIALILMVASKL